MMEKSVQRGRAGMVPPLEESEDAVIERVFLAGENET